MKQHEENLKTDEHSLAADYERLQQENRQLRLDNEVLQLNAAKNARYLRNKINQLLKVMGTVPLCQEELDDNTLLELDPIGILSESFTHVLSHLKETNIELQEKEKFLQTIFTSLEAGIILVRAEDNVITDLNPSACKIIGLQKEQIIGRSCLHFICPNCNGKCPMEDQSISIDNTERLLLTADNRKIPILKTVARVVIQGIPHYLESFVDVSAQKEAEKKLAAEKEQLAVTMRSIAEGVITVDTDGRVLLINQAAQDLIAVDLTETKGKLLNDFFHVSDGKTGESFRLNEPGFMISWERFSLHRAILKSGTGEQIIIDCEISPIFEQQEDQTTIAGAVIVIRDVWQQLRLEKEMLHAEKLESVGLLAGGIAHDFNNLLTSILGNITLAQRMLPPENKAVERLNAAERASLRARDLTQQLLTFSKGGAPVRKSASIAEIVREASLFTLCGSNMKVRIDSASDLCPAEVDAGQISQVIHNLILNADQATPNGGEVVVTLKNRSLKPGEISGLPEGDYISIAISDSGIGIPPESLYQIFDPYFTTKKGGSGLGLATSYSIIAKHKGIITVESTWGVGTTFELFLPATAILPAIGCNQEPSLSVSRKGRVLVMDDVETVRETLGMILMHLGYQPVLSEKGEDALEQYREALDGGEPFDAVIMDLTVPGGMGGRETLERLLEIDPQVIGIVSSGYSTDPIMADYKAYGFKGVVTKPYSTQELNQVLISVLPI